jgi:hypothetical protein
MGTVAPINIVEIGALVVGGALLRLVSAKHLGRNAPASKRDLEAIKTALCAEDGRVIRANREYQSQPFSSPDYDGLGRLYHVTLQMGSTTIRRRVAVRDGAPAILLP